MAAVEHDARGRPYKIRLENRNAALKTLCGYLGLLRPEDEDTFKNQPPPAQVTNLTHINMGVLSDHEFEFLTRVMAKIGLSEPPPIVAAALAKPVQHLQGDTLTLCGRRVTVEPGVG